MPQAKRSKRSYRKSTPVGRLRRNVEKVLQHASLLNERVAPWSGASEEARVVEVLSSEVVGKAREMDNSLAHLEEGGFVPPAKQRSVAWEVGQSVSVARKFRPKYEAAFRDDLARDAGFLDVLEVVDNLPSGEVVVRRRGGSTFMAPKTHLVEYVGGPGGAS